MADDHRSHSAARADLFVRLADIRTGMLGVEGAGHMRPMTHHADETRAELLFVTSRTSALAAEVGQGAMGHFCLVAGNFFGCISGTISPRADAATVDRLWTPLTAAWFTGRDDPDIQLLAMPMREAEVWTSTDSTLHFGFEIARANLDSDYLPHVGTHEVIRF